MTTAVHTGYRWRRRHRSKWRKAWRRTIGALFLIACALTCFWALVGACESTTMTP